MSASNGTSLFQGTSLSFIPKSFLRFLRAFAFTLKKIGSRNANAINTVVIMANIFPKMSSSSLKSAPSIALSRTLSKLPLLCTLGVKMPLSKRMSSITEL